MKIDLPRIAEIRLAQHAKAAGYADVREYVAEQLQAIDEQPVPSELEPLTEDELVASLAMLRESEVDMAAGRTEGLSEAVQGVADELGLKIQR